ncbi:MAG: aminomethyl-transferring glycine dehydrogenase subunit GcvPB [Blastocatellia bacterium AA13]|nr:MAG: aminomethyl-transferring glycine dehydrogenase subunit GcvPB [Blastocatellia bacterium AA13]
MSEKKSRIKKATTHVTQNEGLLFEISRQGRAGYSIPQLDVPELPPEELIDRSFLRTDDLQGLPELSEVDVVRHFTRLSTWNYGVDTGMYPLGSCTMKHNPRINEKVARIDGFANLHPLTPVDLAQGALEVIVRLEECLAKITGLHAVTLQPAAGAHGEMTGMMMIRAALSERGNPRKKVLIPDSAHGTNPASAVICGYTVETVPSNSEGLTDLEALKREMNADVAALMLTNPNTLGKFERNIEEICRIVHDAGGFVYMDGANMNALVGVMKPAASGIDVMHMNLHKTFSTPHGGGGPGAGPVAVTKELEPYLPYPRIVRAGDRFSTNFDRPKSIGRVRANFGNYGMLTRALSYILTFGDEGLLEMTQTAVLNANYIADKLKDTYEIPYAGRVMHEVVFSDKWQTPHGVKNSDISKRLIDYGFYPPTMSFPLIVHGAMMVEPTEGEGRTELDLFIDAMKSINAEAIEEPETLRHAPHSTKVGRLDETAAARKPVLRWRSAEESEAQRADKNTR